MSNWFFRRRTTKVGKTVYYARSRQPVRGKDGKISRKEVERSTGTDSIREARAIALQFEAEYHRLANEPPEPDRASSDVFTFADAVGVYVQSGNSARFLDPILDVIGLRPAEEIGQADCLEIETRIYPGRKASTLNRQVWTPINAVLRFNGIVTKLKRPKGHDRQPTIDRTSIPTDGWFAAVEPYLSPTKRALLLLLNLHGLRIGEAIQRTPNDLDPKRWTLTLPNTKDGNPYVIKLSEPVIEAIKAYDWRSERWLFGTAQRSNIARDLKKACDKAGVPYFSSHKIGRHSFASKILEDGRSLPYLKKAGRWRSLKAVERYSHLAKSEVDEEVRDAGKRWHESRKAGEVVPLRKKRESG